MRGVEALIEKIKSNILIQYTLISLLLTLAVATALGWLVSVQLKDQLINSHGDFYRAFIGSVDENYSEIIPLLSGGDQTHGEEDHGHVINDDQHGTPDSWSHIRADLAQFPFVRQLWLYDNRGELIWSFDSGEPHLLPDDFPRPGKGSGGDDYLVHITEDEFLVDYVISIEVGGGM